MPSQRRKPVRRRFRRNPASEQPKSSVDPKLGISRTTVYIDNQRPQRPKSLLSNAPIPSSGFFVLFEQIVVEPGRRFHLHVNGSSRQDVDLPNMTRTQTMKPSRQCLHRAQGKIRQRRAPQSLPGDLANSREIRRREILAGTGSRTPPKRNEDKAQQQ